MLMRSRDCRLAVNPEDISRLLTDEAAISVAEAIIYDDPDELRDIWRTVGDSVKIGVISRGEIFLSEMIGLDDGEKWESILAGLEASRLRGRILEIQARMSAGAATSDEVNELVELQRRLQGLRI